MPISDEGRPVAFVMALLATMIVALGTVAGLNLREDPVGAFSRPLPIAHDAPDSPFRRLARHRQLLWAMRRAASTERPFVLLGPSNVLYGVDVCGRLDVERLPLPGLENRETAQILETVMPRLARPTTFAVVVAGDGAVPPAPRSLGWTWDDLLAASTTQLSLERLVHPAVTASARCHAPGAPENVNTDFSDRHVAETMRKFDGIVSSAGVDAILTAFGRHCGPDRHRLVLLTMPVFVTARSRTAAGRIVARHGAWLRTRVALQARRTPACRIAFRDTATEYVRGLGPQGAARADWWDTSHFRPALGERLLGPAIGVRSPRRTVSDVRPSGPAGGLAR